MLINIYMFVIGLKLMLYSKPVNRLQRNLLQSFSLVTSGPCRGHTGLCAPGTMATCVFAHAGVFDGSDVPHDTSTGLYMNHG